MHFFFFVKRKTAYEMLISDWSSDVCSSDLNDAIGNIAVVAAALGVFGTGTGWPDIVVAAILAMLGLSGGWQIVRQALGELRGDAAAENAALRAESTQIGRASCRESVCQYMYLPAVAVSLYKKTGREINTVPSTYKTQNHKN